MINGSDYIELALAHIDGDEPHFRCSVSRFYYGVLHLTIDSLIKYKKQGYAQVERVKNGIDLDKSIHTTTINNTPNAGLKGNLEVIKTIRVWADYFLEHEITPDNPLDIYRKNRVIRQFTSTEEIKDYIKEMDTDIDNRLKK